MGMSLPHNRLKQWSWALFQINNGLSRTVVDVHYYNLFDDATFKNMTVQQNIDYIKTIRAQTVQSLVSANGPLIFVGKYLKSLQLLVWLLVLMKAR